MDIITIMLFMVAIGIYIASILIKKNELDILSLVISTCAIGGVLIDGELVDFDKTVVLIPMIVTWILSCLGWMGLIERK